MLSPGGSPENTRLRTGYELTGWSTELTESDVYEIEGSEYVRKAEIDEGAKEIRLQGLKDGLAAAEHEEAEELREDIEALEDRIGELPEFRSGQAYHTRPQQG